MEKALARVGKVRQGHPLDPATMIGAQASNDQLEKILSYIDIGRKEGAKVLIGGERSTLEGELKDGYYVKPTVFEGHNRMRIFQEEIFGPVLSVTTFETEEEALSIANDTLYGLGAGVWTRDGNRAYRCGRAIQAGRVWTNCYHAYPAHAAFGGYKQSGIGRETHKMMLDHYQQTKESAGKLQPESSGLLLSGIRRRGGRPRAVRTGKERVMVERVIATPAALALILKLERRHGPLMFHQSGGCCDGSSPMCYPAGEFRIGGSDVRLGAIGNVPFYIGAAQFEYWQHTQLIIDVVPGRGGGFSLEAPEGLRFLTRSSVFTDAELSELALVETGVSAG